MAEIGEIITGRLQKHGNNAVFMEFKSMEGNIILRGQTMQVTVSGRNIASEINDQTIVRAKMVSANEVEILGYSYCSLLTEIVD